MKRIQILSGLVVALMFLASCAGDKKANESNQNEERPIRVETVIADISNKAMVLNYSGLITPMVETRLSFQLPGTVQQIYVHEGDNVQKNQLLAELDNSSFRSAYKAAQATQSQAQDAYDRLKSVYDKGSLPEIEWEDIKTKLAQANASEQIARNNLNNCSLKAPSNGVIGSKNIELGSSVLPGVSVIDLVKISKVLVKISVPENEINKIRKGQKASITIPAISEHIYEGKVERVGVVANRLSKTYEVKIRIDNSQLAIKPGMVCDVDLKIQNTEETITVPSQAVVKDVDDKSFVYLVDEKNNTAKKQTVEVGEFLNNNLQIISGIRKGDVVVVNGQHKLSKNSYVAYN